MNKKIEYARRFMLSVSPPNSHIKINDVFQAMIDAPAPTFVAGLQSMIEVEKEGKDMAMVTYGMLQGIAMMTCLHEPLIQEMMENYLKSVSRAQGENIVNFANFSRGLK